MLRGVLAIRGQAAARGYGFIEVEGREDDVFVLGSEITDEHGGPATRGPACWSSGDQARASLLLASRVGASSEGVSDAQRRPGREPRRHSRRWMGSWSSHARSTKVSVHVRSTKAGA